MVGAGAPDFFYREAQRLGYVARSAFKLLQMQNQFKLIKPGSSVLDLGCAPGAWLQVACQSLGPLKNGGVVVGVDIKKVKVPPLHCDARVLTVAADVMNLSKQKIKALSPKVKGYSVVLSDMCPSVSGITTRDAALSMELGMRALHVAVGDAASAHSVQIKQDSEDADGVLAVGDAASAHSVQIKQDSEDADGGVLLAGGNLVIKLLESEDIQELHKICKPLFKKASWLRPKGTRSTSKEIYLICQGLKLQGKE